MEVGDDDGLPQQYVERVVTSWVQRGQDRHELSKALLTAAINILIEEDTADETAQLLVGLAAQIATPKGEMEN